MEGYAWWQRGCIYQIYPRSFMDSDGDGIGDLQGIRMRLDHLVDLGVDAIWISPIYPSPMADFGYDVSDYRDVHPIFGTLADFDALVRDCHARGLRVILDFVPNHTSDRHPWFLEARSTRASRRRDWYIWHDPAPDGGPPNNWQSHFGGSAWCYDQATGQYYLHMFLEQQPDLNWRNPAVQEAMHDVLRFWLDRGVDGFRVDVIWLLVKDDRFRDNPPNPDWSPGQPPFERLIPLYTADRPEVHDLVAGMRRVLDSYGDRVLIGEIYLPVDRLVAYYGSELSGAHLPFNFQLLDAPWHARTLNRLIRDYEAELPEGGWPNWVLGNHDKPRIASRIGPDRARLAVMLLLTLRGTPTLYYGDEIGMRDVLVPPDRVQDPVERNLPGLGKGRDPQRTPMQWDDGPHAGFTTGEPWLPVAEDHARMNVRAQAGDPGSMLSLVRTLLRLRRTSPALAVGDYVRLHAEGDVLAFTRRAGQECRLILLNLAETPTRLPPQGARGEVVLSTGAGRAGEPVGDEIALDGFEGLLVALEAGCDLALGRGG